MKLQRDAQSIFKAALSAADASEAVKRHLKSALPRTPFQRTFLLAIGKAAIPMAAAVQAILRGRLTASIAITKHGHVEKPLKNTQVFEAGHPIPDEAGLAGANAVESLLRTLNAQDLLIVAISGGASALLSAPAEGITLAGKQKTTDMLLRAGADIFELNAVRKHLSRLKGGRLAALAYPATVVSLLLSDVVGDPLRPHRARPRNVCRRSRCPR